MKTILGLFAFLGFFGIINAQETISSEELIGTWTYLGPEKLSLNDTITLTKDQTNDKAFSHWTFIARDNELEMYVRINQDNDKAKAIDVKSKGFNGLLKLQIC